MKKTIHIPLWVILVFFFGCQKPSLFQKISASSSGIRFNNKIVENDSINPLSMVNVYNGGGVGIGDFNNDGLQDIYFTGNMVSNKLYLNKGDFKFEDVTEQAKVNGDGRWCRGVSVIDINNDGRLDIYITATLLNDPQKRKNLLYINLGLDDRKNPRFKEMASEYKLDDTSHSTMANFFDYDNDGDLDMYLVVNEIPTGENPNKFRPIVTDGSYPSTGKLYRNDWDPALKHPVFKDVSAEAGITKEGFGHSATISDINLDGWSDIYVANDFVGNNLLYINNADGTFTDQAQIYFKHTAANAMGQDIIDINNDGLADIVELDMNPEDNYRKKMMMSANSYQTYQNFDYYGYQYQYVKNTLQLNRGPRVEANDSIGPPIFSEIGFLSGISQTDWSWTPVVSDFDNDGFRDIIVTNGYPRDVTDHDFMVFRQEAYSIASKSQILDQIPIVKLHNYAFKNAGNLNFEDVSKQWGLDIPTFSNGAVYADLDNDGDLDMVINNINDEAFIYRNNSREKLNSGNHYLQIKFTGPALNRGGIGAHAFIYYDGGKIQAFENTPYRGYLSSNQNLAHFGIGKATGIDSLVIHWRGNKKQVLKNVKADQLLTVRFEDAAESSAMPHLRTPHTLFREVSKSLGVNYRHKDQDFVDFNIQKLLPHKFTEYGPALAAGDLNGDGLDDIVSAGSSTKSAQIFFQQPNGKFVRKSLLKDEKEIIGLDQGILLFDADNDNDLDIYITSGGYEHAPNTSFYQDKFFENDGKGNFRRNESALPKNYTSKFCVRAADYDKDGDLDLFVAGRVEPWHYPKPVSSFIFRNDSKNGVIKFTDVTPSIAKSLVNVGLVCDAVFTDFDNDGWQDLLIAGEWMPLTFLKNKNGVFEDVSEASTLKNKIGWWNTIAPGDFDNDGDIDYVVGNLGTNSFYKASEKYPVCITAKDFDSNGSYDAFPSLFLPDQKGELKEFPAQTRDDIVKQMISMRAKFQNYRSFAVATIHDIFTEDQLKGALRLEANYLSSSFIRNEGNGRFSIHALPVEAQVSVLNGIVVDDFNGDGNLDLVINGNDFGTEVSLGRYDALNGLLLEGDGKGNFIPVSILESGIFIPGNGKALAALRGTGGNCLLAASQNKGDMKIFEAKKKMTSLALSPDDVSALLKYSNGKTRRQEFYYGSSFLSQSSRFLPVSGVKSVEVKNVKGQTRKLL